MYPYLFFLAIEISKTTGNGFQIGLIVRHIVIIREGPLCGHIGERHYTSPFVHGICLIEALHDLMEGEGGYVPTLCRNIVLLVRIGPSLANIYGRADSIRHKLQFAARSLHG